MFHLVLIAPEIPPNTGNVIRLCANTGCRLHLVRPLGFDLSDAQLRRAGLDYHDMACVTVHADWEECQAALGDARLFAFTTRGSQRHADVAFRPGDAFVFGSESAGLPAELLARFTPGQRLRLPLIPGNRSLNLSNAVAVAVYEAWRQQAFAGGA